MSGSIFLMSPDDEIRGRVLLEHRLRDQIDFSGNDLLGRQVDLLVLAYVELAQTLEFLPTPDVLANFGWPGLVLQELFCADDGMWDAFSALVARRYPGLLNPV